MKVFLITDKFLVHVKNTNANNYGVRTEDPYPRTGAMYGFNAMWLMSSMNLQEGSGKLSAQYMEGGSLPTCYYVVLKCARQIPHWTQDEASTDKILFSRVTTRATEEQHEGKKGDKAIEKASILIDHYCDIHKTALGNPELYFESMDRRLRAHPTPAVFSLENGIESFPDTLVECIEHDSSLSNVERALKDVRLLSKREQMHNLATLGVYKGVLEFIIEVHRELPQHQIRILDWFNNIKNNAREANAEPDERQSPRKKRKTSKKRK